MNDDFRQIYLHTANFWVILHHKPKADLCKIKKDWWYTRWGGIMLCRNNYCQWATSSRASSTWIVIVPSAQIGSSVLELLEVRLREEVPCQNGRIFWKVPKFGLLTEHVKVNTKLARNRKLYKWGFCLRMIRKLNQHYKTTCKGVD